MLPLRLDTAGGTWLSANPPTLQLHLQTQLPAGRPYLVEWTEDFTTWTPLQSGNGTGAVLDILADTVNPTKRFYRLQIPP